MEEITCNKKYQEHTLIKVLGITSLTILIFAGVAGAAPFAYVTNLRDYDQGGYYYDMNYNGTVPTPYVAVIDTATNNITARVSLGGGWPVGVAVNPRGTKAYVASATINNVFIVYVIDTAANTVNAKVNIESSYPSGITFNPAGTRVYVTKQRDNTDISVINTATNTLMAPVIVEPSTYGIAFTPDGEKIYATNTFNNTIYAIDAATNKVTANISVGDSPYKGVVTPDGKKVYVPNYDSNTVSVINTDMDNVIATVPVGNSPNLVAVTSDGNKVYVANNNTVSVIDTATDTVTATVNAGVYPTNVVIVPLTDSDMTVQSTGTNSNVTEDVGTEKTNLSSEGQNAVDFNNSKNNNSESDYGSSSGKNESSKNNSTPGFGLLGSLGCLYGMWRFRIK
ncbi:40-residue YVTN family beta-propeller repeat [Methanosarcina siciliae T4/M]|uniref:40-residue YVTN family beta-propeller repeat n=1 Tax=Methanosarcina siciliae T4/M TaxID=1434120 RepID=A0A0E3L7P6_9EURY|nr:YncE family protein [Methanosarcina siciliae]AKB27136.1 40-residue YVTN family beta-propeller repeat [Methanosarcina siciliae T4/M]